MELSMLHAVLGLLFIVAAVLVWHALEVRKYMKAVAQNTQAAAIYLRNMDKNLAVGVTHGRALALHFLPKAEEAKQ